MRKHRLVIYVTLLGDSEMVEWYAVESSDGEPSDLTNDGFSRWSNLPSDLSDASRDWLRRRVRSERSSS